MANVTALLVGCNYPRTSFRLHGCINDVISMRKMLTDRCGLKSDQIKVLIDVPVPEVENSELPTGKNIKEVLENMVANAQPGDVLFFHFSGHGTVKKTLELNGAYREDEAIVPCDLNLIFDVDLRHLIRDLPEGTSFTILSDSCHSGGLIDKDKEQIGPSTERALPHQTFYFKKRGIPFETVHRSLLSFFSGLAQHIPTVLENVPTIIGAVNQMAPLFHGIFKKDASIHFLPENEKKLYEETVTRSLSENEGILLSACQADETAADVTGEENPHGAFTDAVLKVLHSQAGDKANPLTNKELVKKARRLLSDDGFEQHPCLYCSNDNSNVAFLPFDHGSGTRGYNGNIKTPGSATTNKPEDRTRPPKATCGCSQHDTY